MHSAVYTYICLQFSTQEVNGGLIKAFTGSDS